LKIEDLNYIFKDQIDNITDEGAKLFFMVVDNGHAVIQRHAADDLGGLLPMLDCFVYDGADGGIPRFTK